MIDQKNAAKIQLDRAIQLFLDQKDYVSAITLAGAAEGLVGEMLEKNGAENALISIVKGFKRLLSEEEREALCGEKKTFEKSMIDDLNLVKNWLKHYFPNSESLHIDVDSDCKEIAYDLIDRASSNYVQAFGDETEQMRRFLEFQLNEHN